MTLFDILELVGFLIRALGSLVFGLGAGWLAVRVLKADGTAWQLAIATFLGLVGAFALLGHWVAGGATIGAFGLGAGAAVLVWGMMPMRAADSESKQK